MKRLTILFVALALCAMSAQACVQAPAQVPAAPQMPAPQSQEEANKQLVASNNEEIWNQHKLDLIGERYTSNYVRHQPGYPAELPGAEGLKQFLQGTLTSFPNWNCTIEDLFAAGDKVAARYNCGGNQTGPWMGIPPTGRALKFTCTIIHRLADGKVVEDWVDYDSLGMMQQLGFGLVPAGQAEANKAIIRRAFEAFNTGKLDDLDGLMGPGFVDHFPVAGQKTPDLAGLKQAFADFRASFPDMTCPIEDSIAEGDKVMVLTTCRGTHKGAFAGIPPTGKQVTEPGMVMYRISDGMVVDRWGLFNDLGLMMQVGAFPPPAAPSATQAPAATAFPIGIFTNPVGWTWEFKDDGRQVLQMPQLTASGTHTVSGNQIVFKESSDTCGLGAEKGTYTWIYDGKTLTFKVIDDRCGGRVGTITSGPWVKKP